MSTNAHVLTKSSHATDAHKRAPEASNPTCMERGRGCAFRCAAASTVNPSRFPRANCTHLRAATSCTAAAHAAALREDAPVSDSSQLLLRTRKVAGATTHRPFWSMSRRVSDAPHMRPPLSQQRRRHGQRRPSNGEFKPLSLATSANALWKKGLCPPQGDARATLLEEHDLPGPTLHKASTSSILPRLGVFFSTSARRSPCMKRVSKR